MNKCMKINEVYQRSFLFSSFSFYYLHLGGKALIFIKRPKHLWQLQDIISFKILVSTKFSYMLQHHIV